MNLNAELSKPEYQAGTYVERLALLRSKATPTVGHIDTGNLKLLESLIAKGLWRDKMADMKEAARAVLADIDTTTSQKQVAQMQLQVVAGFHEAIAEAKMANKAPRPDGHSINMADADVQTTFAAAQHASVKLITPAEAARVLEIATWQKPDFPDATLRDVIAHFEPSLLDDQWHELHASDATGFVLMLNTPAPEQTHIVIQAQDQYDNGTSDWYHATALHGIEVVRQYVAQLPHNGSPRKLRWKCDYALNAVVSVR